MQRSSRPRPGSPGGGRVGEPLGYTLVELLISLGLAALVLSLAVQLVLGDQRQTARLTRRLRHGQVLGRAVALIEGDLATGQAIALNPDQASHSCGLAGRTPILAIERPEGVTTYSVGRAPSSIWRAPVLMRCGRSFRKDGVLNPAGAARNRLVIDGLDPSPAPWNGCALPGFQLLGSSAEQPLSACLESESGLVHFRLVLAGPEGNTASGRLERQGSAVVWLSP